MELLPREFAVPNFVEVVASATMVVHTQLHMQPNLKIPCLNAVYISIPMRLLES